MSDFMCIGWSRRMASVMHTLNMALVHLETHANSFMSDQSMEKVARSWQVVHLFFSVEKQSGHKDELRITKVNNHMQFDSSISHRFVQTVTRVVDMSSSSVKSTVTVSNDQRPVVVVSNSAQSTRTVIESIPASDDQPSSSLFNHVRKYSIICFPFRASTEWCRSEAGWNIFGSIYFSTTLVLVPKSSVGF